MPPPAVHFEAKKHAYRQTQDGVVISFVVHPSDINADVAAAPLGTQHIVALAPYVEQEEAPQEPAPAPAKPRATRDRTDGETAVMKSALLPKDHAFRAWASAKIGSAASEHDAADYIRNTCGVESRRALAANAVAREKFWQINTQFEIDTGRMARPR